MSEKIRLQVPVEVPEGFPEFVEQGYLSATLTPGEEIEVEDRKFAEWLVRELGLELIDDPNSEASSGAGETPALQSFPEDFPRREIFTGQAITVEALRGKSRDELIDLPGVGEKTADAILEYFAGTESGAEEDGGN